MTSAISHPKRVSGLSEANRSIASSWVRRGNGTGSSSRMTSRQTAANIPSISSKSSSGWTNASSMSSWVNSAVRSARVASSRKQRAIW